MSAEEAVPARPAPYAMAFADPAFEQEHFPAMVEEAAGRGLDVTLPETFLQLSTAGAIVRSILLDDEVTAVARFGPLLFHAFHFWRSGRIEFVLDEAVFRYLVSTEVQIGDWPLQSPEPAAYLRLPRNILWAQTQEDAPPESAHGLFWTTGGATAPAPPARLETLLVLGLLPGRPGFSIVEAGAALPEAPAGHWGDTQVRAGPSPDFGNMLPGGELQRLHALETTGEVLKLVSRVFWYIAAYPQAVHRASATQRSVVLHG